MCKVYTDVGGLKLFYHVFLPVLAKTRGLLSPHTAENPWYKYYVNVVLCHASVRISDLSYEFVRHIHECIGHNTMNRCNLE